MTAFDLEVDDVRLCHRKFRLPIGEKGPAFESPTNLEKRVDFIKEELQEFIDACNAGDLPKAVDGLIDMVYVIKGTAVMMGITPTTWELCWRAVQKANMAKVKTNTDDYHFGLKKPEGWQPPDIEGILRHSQLEHSFPPFRREE